MIYKPYNEQQEILNESLTGLLVGALVTIGLHFVIIAGSCIGFGIDAGIKEKQFKREIEKLLKENKEYDRFYKSIDSVKGCSLKELLDEFDIDENVKNINKYGNVQFFKAIDKDGNIAAYCLYEADKAKTSCGLAKKYGNNKKLATFALAMFELHIGVIGSGIESILGKDKVKKLGRGIIRHQQNVSIKKDEHEKARNIKVSEKEFKEMMKQFIAVSKKIESAMEKYISSNPKLKRLRKIELDDDYEINDSNLDISKIEKDLKEDFENGDKINPYFIVAFEMDEVSSNEYEHLANDFAKAIDIDLSKYPYINIRDDIGGDFCYVEVYARRMIKESFGIFESASMI